jgi:hypothetical protein
MDKWRTTIRVEELRREIAEILANDRIYKTQAHHTVEETDQNSKRHTRLQEIMTELKVLSGQSSGT